MSNRCLVDVNAAGAYVCRGSIIDSDSCAKLVRAANLPAPIDVEVSANGSLSGPWAETGQQLVTGEALILMPGTYRLGFDCEDFSGEAPEDAVTICCSDVDMADALNLEQSRKLDQLMGMLALGTDAAALASMASDVKALCDKIAATNDVLAKTQAAQLECLQDIKERPQALVPLTVVCYE